jgi:hypothetical protein
VPLLLALDQAATVKDLRLAVEQATGISTTECTIHGSSSSPMALGDGRRVFSSDADSLAWANEICRYWLRRKDYTSEVKDKDGQILIQIDRLHKRGIWVICSRLHRGFAVFPSVFGYAVLAMRSSISKVKQTQRSSEATNQEMWE